MDRGGPANIRHLGHNAHTSNRPASTHPIGAGVPRLNPAARQYRGAVEAIAVWDAFDGRPHRPRPGLRRLDPRRWTQPPPAPALVAELERRRRVLADHPAEAVATTPGAEPAAAELLDRLRAHLLGDHAGRYRAVGGGWIEVDGRFRVDTDGAPALAVAAGITAADWCLVAPSDPPRLAAGAVCAPNRWRLRAKVGLDLSGVHAPVPGYPAGPVDRLFGRDQAAPVWRRNWSMLADPALWQPDPVPARPRVPAGVWVRSERQTVVALPASGWWAFGIETEVAPLEALATRPGVAARVLATVAGLDAATARYKELDGWLPELLAWLAACAGPPAPAVARVGSPRPTASGPSPSAEAAEQDE